MTNEQKLIAVVAILPLYVRETHIYTEWLRNTETHLLTKLEKSIIR